jgi:DNA-binding transcriptional MerR regulator
MAEPKSASAFRTIGELSAELGLPQHILRYWETRFPQLRPLTRAGNRRYYRPEDVALVRRIDQALNRDGYTIKGVQKLLKSKDQVSAPAPTPGFIAAPTIPVSPSAPDILPDLMRIRDQLKAALAD